MEDIMAYKYNYNPIEMAFHCWASEFPLSGHPLDERRFFIFIHTLFRYSSKSKKWRSKAYFSKQFKKYVPYCSDEDINRLFQEMNCILYFLESKTGPIRTRELDFSSSNNDYVAFAVINGKMRKTHISKEVYDKRKVTLKHFD